MPAPISAMEWKKREQRIHVMIKPRGGTLQHAKTILYGGHKTPAEVERRLRIMDANGMTIGVTHAFGCTKPKFDEMVRKHMSPLMHKFSPERRNLFLMMVESGISERAALKVLGRSMKNRPINVQARLKILEQKLDFKKYGREKLPVEFFGELIQQRPLDRMRKSIKRLLQVMENKNAERILDITMPHWRKISVIGRRIEAHTVLAKWVYLVKKGVEPSGNLLRQYSLQSLKKMKSLGNTLSPKTKTSLLSRYEKAVVERLEKL